MVRVVPRKGGVAQNQPSFEFLSSFFAKKFFSPLGEIVMFGASFDAPFKGFISRNIGFFGGIFYRLCRMNIFYKVNRQL